MAGVWPERAGSSNGYAPDMRWPAEKRALQNLGKRHPHKQPCTPCAPTYAPPPKSIDLQVPVGPPYVSPYPEVLARSHMEVAFTGNATVWADCNITNVANAGILSKAENCPAENRNT